MADISGLVVGTVALASLFSTCIELFDRFQLGRHHVKSYHQACDKIDLLRVRLEKWGEQFNTCTITAARANPALHRKCPDQHTVIARSLVGIKGILEDASLLKEKYKLVPKPINSFKTLESALPTRYNTQHCQIVSVRVDVKGWIGLRKRTLWAIHDKQKFDDLIQNLSFLIDNLEKATTMSDLDSRRAPATANSNAPRDHVRTSMGQDNPVGAGYHDKNPVDQTKTLASSDECRTNEKPTYDNEFIGTQTNNDNRFGMVGSISSETNRVQTRDLFRVNQNNSGKVVAIMGSAPASLVMAFQEPT